MPLTPFIGLSIIVHVCIIILHKLFNWGPGRTVRYKEMRSTRWISFAIILFIFIFISTNAFLLVRASIVERHSLIQVFSHLTTSKDFITYFGVNKLLAATVKVGELYKPTGMLTP
jgi:hypothetical protein